MLSKILIPLIAVTLISSCSTVYRSTQTPDDVYYSPSRPVYEQREQTRDEIADNYNAERREIVMGIRDRRWRYMNDPFTYGIGYNNIFYNPYSYYSYYNSPYNYCFNNWNNYYGYYYNPYYYPYPIYNPIITKPQPAIVTTPRMVNLNAYSGYDKNDIPAKNSNLNWNGSRNYNNSNIQRGNRVGNIIREVFIPSPGRSNSNNDTRTYNPSRSNNSSGSSSGRSSSSSGSSSGGVSRPGRGG